MAATTYRTGIGNKAATPTVDFKTCDLCGACIRVCGTGLTIKNGKVVFDPDAPFGCIGCGQCMAVCPTGSITVKGRRLSPESAFPIPPAEKCSQPDQLEALLLHRRSVRNFERKAVDKELIDRVVQMATTAPMGIPPSDVGVIVLEGKSLTEFKDDMTKYFKSALTWYFNSVMMAFMRIRYKKADYEMMRDIIIPILRDYLEDRDQKKDTFLYNCPVLLIFHVSPYGSSEDPIIATTYAMIAAESLGLGSCMNGMIAPFLTRSKKLKRKYHIPVENRVGFALMVGYPTVKYHQALRRDFESVTFLT